ncbi:AcrR family transcriptional regulator [Rhizobium paknamense]|uniref:AcrR family transcriptional regulator n=2 Tax=Rhizobium paknamense TaxID=1206817 RepID=A0ABU0IJG2_9HYPH|nr:AcrR family transcriptional regulator [Rhizobium paknamense]
MADQKSPAMLRPGRPSKAVQDGMSDKIIAMAASLFASRGFAGTSMEQVAQSCGAGKDTIYRRFPSKIVLFEAVVAHAHRRAVARLEKMPVTDGTPLEKLRLLLRELLIVNMEPDLISLKRITFSETIVFERDQPIPPQPDPIMERLVAAVRDAQAAGDLVAADPVELATHLIHCLVALPTTAAMTGSAAFDDPARIEAHFQQSWNLLLNGVAPRTRA